MEYSSRRNAEGTKILFVFDSPFPEDSGDEEQDDGLKKLILSGRETAIGREPHPPT